MTFRPVMRRLFLPGWIDGEPCGYCLALRCTSSQAVLYLFRTGLAERLVPLIRTNLGTPTSALFELKLCSSAEEVRKPSLGLQGVKRIMF